MNIPGYLAWVGRARILEQGWTTDLKLSLSTITKEVKNYGDGSSYWKKRKSAQTLQKLIDDFEKAWKKIYPLSPMPKEILELRSAAQDQAPATLSTHKYDFASCIAYKVGTSKFEPNTWVQENINGVQWYRGSLVQYDGTLEDEADRALRCSWMKAAINQAYSSHKAKYPNDPDDAKVLKVFMAPEFFFRGKSGAYDISFFSTILNDMRGLTKDTKFKDWLFVLGTVITATFAGKISLYCRKCKQTVEWGNREDLKSKGFIYEGMDTKGKQIFLCPGPPTSGSARQACPKGSVIDIADKAIIDNMALVQKGGEADDQNFRYVQKENVSAIDFRRRLTQAHFNAGLSETGYTRLGLFNDDWSKTTGRKIELMEGRIVTALPSPGARDVSIPNFDQRPGDTRDEHKSGGSLFTIDEIKFGLEICVDHSNGRLPLDAGVQIQLVPSAGAHIAHFVCRPGGIAFNVDGEPGGRCNVRINTTGDPQSSGAPDHTSGGPPKDGQPGTEIILYEPSPIPWA